RGALREHRMVDAVQGPARVSLVGADEPACKDQLLGEADARRAGQPLRPAPARQDSEVDLRLAEAGRRRCVAEVAGERQLATAAERKPADGRDRDLRHGLEEPRDLLPELCPGRGAGLVDAAHVPDVGAGTEGAVAGPGEHDGTDASVAGELE